MAWRKPDESDLVALLSQKEVDAFRQSADLGDDPVVAQIAGIVELVRGKIRAAGARLGPEGTIPGSLVIPAMCVLRFHFLTRFGVAVSDDRRKAYENAEKLLDDVAHGRLAVEVPDGEEASAPSPLSPAFAPARPARLLD